VKPTLVLLWPKLDIMGLFVLQFIELFILTRGSKLGEEAH
jgi:hypothetical protein